jgi:hypothetical protein
MPSENQQPVAEKPRANGLTSTTSQAAANRAMEKSVATLINEVRTRLNNGEVGLITARYDVARLIAHHAEEHKVTDRQAILAIAEKVGEDDGVLYDAVRIFRTFPQKPDFEALTKRLNKKGRAFSYSHLVALSKEDKPTRRNSLIQQALAFSWTVAQLQDQMNGKSAASVGVSKQPDDQPVNTAPVNTAAVEPRSATESSVPETTTKPPVDATQVAVAGDDRRGAVAALAAMARQLTKDGEALLDLDDELAADFLGMDADERKAFDLDLIAIENAECCLSAIREKLGLVGNVSAAYSEQAPQPDAQPCQTSDTFSAANLNG